MFKRYRHSRYRVLDALGFKIPKNAYDEFWALRDLSLNIQRGERVGIMGRNGAGKSTLLNIVCGRLLPTAGTVTVRGQIQALMELGTGFHPEFSGRENVLASLAYQGVTGAEARTRLDEIVDFAELDEFIDQPVKTYSAGMFARLAFSTATAIDPDVLIIDEVLGAGDAYFAAKCTHRMRQLTEETGATVLFVSHDMASVQKLCNRAVWIERGRIHMVGETLEVSKSYYASILEQEEARLRARTSQALARMRRDAPSEVEQEQVLLMRLVSELGGPPTASHPIRRLSLTTADGAHVEVRPGLPMDNDANHNAYLLTDPEYMLWSPPRSHGGETVRFVEDTGGKYQHAPFSFRLRADLMLKPLAIEIEHDVAPGERLAVEVHDPAAPNAYRRLGLTTTEGGGWRLESFAISRTLEAATEMPDISSALATAPESAAPEQTDVGIAAIPPDNERPSIGETPLPDQEQGAPVTPAVDDSTVSMPTPVVGADTSAPAVDFANSTGDPAASEQELPEFASLMLSAASPEPETKAEIVVPLASPVVDVEAAVPTSEISEPRTDLSAVEQRPEETEAPAVPVGNGDGAAYRDKWDTAEASFIEIVPCNPSTLRTKFVFALGESIGFKIVTEFRVRVPSFWLVGVIYDELGNRVAMPLHEFARGASPGRHEILLVLDRPTIRQGEYVMTVELLPEFDFYWPGDMRLPYLCHWDRCVFIKVDEGYSGTIPLGLVDIKSTIASTSLADGRQHRDLKQPVPNGGYRLASEDSC